MDHCSKEKEIDRLTAAVFGNGKKGLTENVGIIIEKIDSLEQILSELRTGVSGLMKFQTQVLTEKKTIDSRKLNAWQITSILSSIILSIGAIVASVIFRS